MHKYEVRPRKDHRGVNLISDALPFGRLWYGDTKCGQQRNRLREVLKALSSIPTLTVAVPRRYAVVLAAMLRHCLA
jgi:hypothetical protein